MKAEKVVKIFILTNFLAKKQQKEFIPLFGKQESFVAFVALQHLQLLQQCNYFSLENQREIVPLSLPKKSPIS